MTELLVVITITVFAVLSPGADFALVTRNSLMLSRRHGVLTALGVGLGVMLHVGYSLLGVGVLLQQSPLGFTALKIAGAMYLIYLGFKLLRSPVPSRQEAFAGRVVMSGAAALRSGLLTNALNPKTMIFVLSLFMQVIEPGTALPVQLGYGAIIVLVHVVWFVVVALFFSAPAIAGRLLGYKRRIDQVFGAVLVGFGLLLGVLGAGP